VILTLNLGSSSLKFGTFADDTLPHEKDQIGSGTLSTSGIDVDSVLEEIAQRTTGSRLRAIGHRVAFGGEDHVEPEIVTDALLAKLDGLVPLLPLHLPREISLMRKAAKRFAGIPQVACFDTAFHAAMPAVAKRMAIPRKLWNGGFRRYGFHGLSYEYIVGRLGEDARGRVIIAHLGSGASLAAVRDGFPVDTTMGFSVMSGLMMGTRPGDLDPGVLVSLMRSGYDAETLNRLLEEECGLLGVSEISADVAVLLERQAHDARAAEALELFAYTARKHIGALTSVLGGLDLLVFTGGIGEHAGPVRDAIVAGVVPPKPEVRVIPTDENLMIARHTYATMRR
jgi:acetate kinase